MAGNAAAPRLKKIQEADLKGKIVLLRVDHNVIKRGVIKDNHRINATLGTIYYIAHGGGKPIVMTHIDRPRQKDTGKIVCRPDETVDLIVEALERRLGIKIAIPDFPIDSEKGILGLDKASLVPYVEDLKSGKTGMIYLPNIRWFQGEQGTETERDAFARELASVADIFVNDAFSSWRPHASTYDVAGYLPSYAGILLQEEIKNTKRALEPERPFLAVVAGSKYDTKIGPLRMLYDRVDHLILGGLMYNTYLCAKYGARIAGVSEKDISLAMELVDLDHEKRKILELRYLVESDTMEGKLPGEYRTVDLHDIRLGGKFGYLLDTDPRSFHVRSVKDVFCAAGTIFVNAVMGYMPQFAEGSRALYRMVASNKEAMKLFGGGDTLQELKMLCPEEYVPGLDDPQTYYFMGGGSLLAALEKGSPYELETIKALME